MAATVVTGRQFQSTPSVWRETHSMRKAPFCQAISIHSLRVEGDPLFSVFRVPDAKFQSTPSVWRETNSFTASPTLSMISIHSLRVEGDPSAVLSLPSLQRISIHSLRVEGDTKHAVKK